MFNLRCSTRGGLEREYGSLVALMFRASTLVFELSGTVKPDAFQETHRECSRCPPKYSKREQK
jgi:hypothetical protein